MTSYVPAPLIMGLCSIQKKLVNTMGRGNLKTCDLARTSERVALTTFPNQLGKLEAAKAA